MSTHNKRDKICVVIVIASLLLTVLFMNGESLGITKIVDEDAESYSGTTYFTANDQDSDWDTDGATVITLTGDSAEISGNNAYVNGQEVVITEAGKYVISGSLTDGKITVDAHNSSKVWILLDGVDINCSDDACIRVDKAEKVFLTLAEGSQNTLTSGSTYSDSALQDGTDGVIFAHDDLTINGSGSLTVNAAYRHGIAANDDLVITGGTITITAVADAIHANDSIAIKDAQITVEAGDDGIVTSNEEEDGSMYIESGTIQITSADDGIHATGDITIAGGSITIAAGDDGIHSDQDVFIENGEILINDCYEGVEALIIDVSGGTITIINDSGRDADGLDSNEDIKISGGTIYISLLGSGSNCAIDYGSESGGIAEITGGTIIACGASSMAEGFDTSSTQASILYNTSTTVEASTTLALEDEEGNTLLSWEVPCSFNSALISCPEMQVGQTYQVVIGDSSEEITLEEISASYGDGQSGMVGGNMGGGMNGVGNQYGDFSEGGFEGWPFNSDGSNSAEGTSQEEGTEQEQSAAQGRSAAQEQGNANAQGNMPAMPEGMQGGHGGRGGHGGKGQMRPDMTQDGTTGGQTPPDMSQDSTTGGQTPPDMSQDGTTGGQVGGPMMGEQGQQEMSQEEEDQAEEQTVTAQTVDTKSWAIYGGCAALLIAAIAVSMLYKRH